jgi:hypothetical protein
MVFGPNCGPRPEGSKLCANVYAVIHTTYKNTYIPTRRSAFTYFQNVSGYIKLKSSTGSSFKLLFDWKCYCTSKQKSFFYNVLLPNKNQADCKEIHTLGEIQNSYLHVRRPS